MAKRETIDQPLRPDETPSPLEGLELVQAFRKIKAAEERQKLIELAKRLSADAQ